MTSVAVNCLVYIFISTLVPLPNESIVALLPSLLHVGLPLSGVHCVGCRSPRVAGHHLRAVASASALGFHLVVDWLHAAGGETLCLPGEVDLAGWTLGSGVPGAAALGGHDDLVDSCVGSSHGVYFAGLDLVAGLGHGASRRCVVVFDVVTVRPAVVLVLIDAVWIFLTPVAVGLEGGRANCGAPLLHCVPCLVPPDGGGDGGVGPVRGLLLEGAGHLALHVGVVLHGVVKH